MVEEVDKNGQIGQGQNQRDRDRQMRNEVTGRPAADGNQRKDRVEECRHESAERDLRSAVADEVA